MCATEGPNTNDRLLGEAVDWFVRMQSDDVGDGDYVAHAEWLEADPRHQAAYDSLIEDWTKMDVSSDFARQRLAELEATDGPSGVIRPAAWRRPVYLAVAAMAVLAVAIGLWVSRATPEVFITRAGEQRSVILADGSTVHLNTKSEIGALVGRSTRRVDLRTGEALFEVERDPDRPFVVDAGAGRVTVVGTSFNIYRTIETTLVTVVEGTVSVSPQRATGPPAVRDVVLTRGQQVTISSRGDISAVRTVDLDGVTAWRQRRLHFDGVPLESVAAEIGRYFEERIEVSADVADLEVIANIKLRSLDSTIGFLEEILPIEVTRVSGDVVRLGSAGGE